MKRVILGSIIPKCPTKARNRKYKSIELHLDTRDGSVADFKILPNRYSAAGFIVSQLNDTFFPMAKDQCYLNDYINDPQWYREDMENYEAEGYWCEDDSLYFESRGNSYWINDERTLQSCITAIRASDYVDCLVFENGYDSTVYNGYIYYDEDIDWWRATESNPDDSGQVIWKNINGTMVEDIDPNTIEVDE